MTDPWSLEERASNLIGDTISPRLLPDIELLRYRDTHLPGGAGLS